MAPILAKTPPPAKEPQFIQDLKSNISLPPLKWSIFFILFAIAIIITVFFVGMPKIESIVLPYDNYDEDKVTVTFNNKKRIFNYKLIKNKKEDKKEEVINFKDKNVKIEFNPYNKSDFALFTNNEFYYNDFIFMWFIIVMCSILILYFSASIIIKTIWKEEPVDIQTY